MSKLVNGRDQHFVLFEQLGIEKLFATENFSAISKDDLMMIIKEAEKLCANVIEPTYKDGDHEGCTFKDGKVYVPNVFSRGLQEIQRGWLARHDSFPRGWGQGLPHTVGNACAELISAANFAFWMYPGLTNGAAA